MWNDGASKDPRWGQPWLYVQIVHDITVQHPVTVADSSSDPEQLGCHSQLVLYVDVCRILLRNDYLSDSGTLVSCFPGNRENLVIIGNQQLIE